MTEAQLFGALGNKTKRKIIKKLSKGPLRVKSISQGLGISGTSLSVHLKSLAAVKIIKGSGSTNKREYTLQEGFWMDYKFFASLRGVKV